MDNVTHSLFGYALGRAGEGATTSQACRNACVWASVIASNLPDADFIAGFFAGDRQLAYLLHHRGHTHTLLVALPLGLLTGFVSTRIAGVRDPGERLRVWALAVLACLLHIAFDAFNNYGVHPFAPFENRWYYGDAVFIIEPLLLAVLIPLLARGGHTRLGRTLGYMLALGLLALLLGSGVLGMGHALVLAASLAAALLLLRPPRVGARGTLAAVAGVLLIFYGSAQVARSALRAELAQRVPNEHVLDLVTTPSPGNPLCWDAIALTLDGSGRYRARLGNLALAPGLLSLDACSPARPNRPTAPLAQSALPSSPRVRLPLLFEGDATRLRALRDRYCDAAAMLRFLRAPFWSARAERTVLGDLRYDRSPALEFAERALDGHCPDSLPPWIPPRADDLLRPSGADAQ